ncbi:hypothetical protein U1Q18_049350 [Sarracenia purpurea var. burkii]
MIGGRRDKSVAEANRALGVDADDSSYRWRTSKPQIARVALVSPSVLTFPQPQPCQTEVMPRSLAAVAEKPSARGRQGMPPQAKHNTSSSRELHKIVPRPWTIPLST